MQALCFCILPVAAALFVASSERAGADEIAMTLPGSQVGILFSSEFVGYRFSVSSPMTVTALGYYDYQGNGLNSSHLVQLWDVGSQQLLTSKLVVAGTDTTLVNGFRFQTLDTPLNLLIGGTYLVVGQFVSGDGDTLGTTSAPVMGPDVNYISGAGSGSSSPLVFPGGQAAALYAGGNFLYTTVPEPSSLAMMGLAASLGLMVRKRR